MGEEDFCLKQQTSLPDNSLAREMSAILRLLNMLSVGMDADKKAVTGKFIRTEQRRLKETRKADLVTATLFALLSDFLHQLVVGKEVKLSEQRDRLAAALTAQMADLVAAIKAGGVMPNGSLVVKADPVAKAQLFEVVDWLVRETHKSS